MEDCQSGLFANLDKSDWVGKAHPELLYKDERKEASEKAAKRTFGGVSERPFCEKTIDARLACLTL